MHYRIPTNMSTILPMGTNFSFFISASIAGGKKSACSMYTHPEGCCCLLWSLMSVCPVQQVCVLYSTGKVGVSSGKSVYLVAIYASLCMSCTACLCVMYSMSACHVQHVCVSCVLWQSLCVLYSNSVCPVAKSVCLVANLCVLYISGSECDEEGTCGDQSLSISETDQLSLCPSETVGKFKGKGEQWCILTSV